MIAKWTAVLCGLGLAGPPSVATAAGSIGPEPIRPADWIVVDDYPPEEMRLGHEGTVTFQVAIDEKGAPISCSIRDTSGWPVLDAKACLLMLQRGRFKPARDESGAAISSTFNRKAAWTMPASGSPKPEKWEWADIDISVSRLLKGREARIVVKQIVSTDGQVESCTPEDDGAVAPLVTIACKQIASQGKAMVDRSGVAVRALYTWRVRFMMDALRAVAPPLGGPTFTMSSFRTTTAPSDKTR